MAAPSVWLEDKQARVFSFPTIKANVSGTVFEEQHEGNLVRGWEIFACGS